MKLRCSLAFGFWFESVINGLGGQNWYQRSKHPKWREENIYLGNFLYFFGSESYKHCGIYLFFFKKCYKFDCFDTKMNKKSDVDWFGEVLKIIVVNLKFGLWPQSCLLKSILNQFSCNIYQIEAWNLHIFMNFMINASERPKWFQNCPYSYPSVSF